MRAIRRTGDVSEGRENRDTVLQGRLTYSGTSQNLTDPIPSIQHGIWRRMLRRLTAVLLIWMSLLGVAFPALACSLAASADCCGQAGTSSPCAGGAGFTQLPDVTTALCCSSGNAASESVAIDSRGASHERDQLPSSPDPVVLIA